MTTAPRILILTAAFGEGHNSAARNLAHALNAQGAVASVKDPCMLASPRLMSLVNSAYRLVTTRFPRFWKIVYESTARHDFSRRGSPVMRKVDAVLVSLVDEFKPDAVVSTYPLYPYFLPHILEALPKKVPAFTVVTDSIEINAAWIRLKCDAWLVTDEYTRERMIESGVSAAQLIATGFPVHPDLSKLVPLPLTDSCKPFRILYFPMANAALLADHATAILSASPDVVLTMVLGRNLRLLYKRAREVKAAFPGRVRILGWTRRVPQLLGNHHLVVGKAGGATVHEAIAACCPMMIHHLVPGQEEGNLELLEIINGGGLADEPKTLKRSVNNMLADNAAGWRAMKAALATHNRNDGAIAAAKVVLKKLMVDS